MAKVDIGMCAGTLRYYGGWSDKVEGKVIDTNAETFNYTKQEPVRPTPFPVTPIVCHFPLHSTY